MPYVNVQVTEGISYEQKKQLIAEITDTLARVLDKRPDQTHIVIDEIPLDNWGFDGVTTTEYLKRKK